MGVSVLVIGGTRFIGAEIVRALLRTGAEVAVLNRGQSPVAPPDGVRRIRGDRDELAASADAIRAFAPDIVLHNIVLRDRHVLEAQEVVRGIASRFVLVSSMDVYRAYGRLIGTEPGSPDPVPLTEDSPLRDVLHPYRAQAKDETDLRYVYDKIPAEQAALADADLPGTVLRLPMVLGPSDYQHRLFPYIRPMADGRDAIVLPEEYARWRSTTGYVTNVAEAIVRAALTDRAAGRTYNVGDANPSVLELAKAVADELSWPGRFLLRPVGELPEALDPGIALDQDLTASMDRLEGELAFASSVSFAEGIARTVAWEREHAPDPLPSTTYDVEDAVLSSMGAAGDVRPA